MNNSLKRLFLIEMWERFGFYLTLDLLVYALTEQFGLGEGLASSRYGLWMALLYLAPLGGGALADRVLGYRRSVALGGALMCLGYLAMALACRGRALPAFYAAMGLVIVGNGLFKPNISAMVGGLYPPGDPRTESAFAWFYVGVNCGALLAPLAGAAVRNHLSTAAAFAVAGAGMALGCANALRSWAQFADLDQRSSLGAATHVELPSAYTDAPDPRDRQRVVAILTLCLVIVPFWAVFHQNGSSMKLFTRDAVDLTLGGLLSLPWLRGPMEALGFAVGGKLDPVLFDAVNSLCVLGFTAPLLALWSALRRRGWEPSTPAKIGVGMVVTALAYLVMVGAALAAGGGAAGDAPHRVSALWVVANYAVITVAELCLSPMGLALVSRLAPRRMAAQMLGCWYAATALGNYLCGALGSRWDRWPHPWFFGACVGLSLSALVPLALRYRALRAAIPEAPPQVAVLVEDRAAIPLASAASPVPLFV